MTPEQQASTSEKAASKGAMAFVYLVIAAIFGLVILATVQDPEPRSYTPDTEYTLKHNGSLWGDCEIVHPLAEIAKESKGSGDLTVKGYTLSPVLAECTRIDSLPSNPPWPPYYDATDNDSVVRVGDQRFGFCQGNNLVAEMPATAVTCELLEIGGRGDHHAKHFGKIKGIG